MTEQMRVRRRWLATPLRCYTHSATGRRAWLVGMIHHGEARYYTEVRSAVEALRSGGAVVLSEGTGRKAMMENPPPDLTAEEREVLDLEERLKTLRTLTHPDPTWVTQSSGFGGVPDGWQRADLGYREMTRQVGVEVVLHQLRDAVTQMEAIQADTKKIKRARQLAAVGYRVVAAGAGMPGKVTDPVMIDRRNEAALAGVDATDRNVVLVWGAAHLPGLAKGLHERGFVLQDETWYRVGRLPSMVLTAPALIGTVVETVRLVVKNARAADDAARRVSAPHRGR